MACWYNSDRRWRGTRWSGSPLGVRLDEEGAFHRIPVGVGGIGGDGHRLVGVGQEGDRQVGAIDLDRESIRIGANGIEGKRGHAFDSDEIADQNGTLRGNEILEGDGGKAEICVPAIDGNIGYFIHHHHAIAEDLAKDGVGTAICGAGVKGSVVG